MGGGKKRSRPEESDSSRGKSGNQNRHGKKNQKDDDLNSWISDLAKKASADSTVPTSTLSKQERIQKRAAKKQKRELQKQQQTKVSETPRDDRKTPPVATPTAAAGPHNGTTSGTRKSLRQLALACRRAIPKSDKKYRKPFEGFPPQKRKGKNKRWNEDNVQPRPRDYGGLGLARKTLWMTFEDPAFVPRLVEEFEEHVEGFFGKQRTKAMKKQLDGNMLWRQLQDDKKKAIISSKVKGKSLQTMTPDERVEAMLKAGML